MDNIREAIKNSTSVEVDKLAQYIFVYIKNNARCTEDDVVDLIDVIHDALESYGGGAE